MKNILMGMVLAGLAGLGWADEMSPVKLQWKNPEQFRDVKAANESQKRYQQRVFDTLERFLQKKTAVLLAGGQSLELTVHDLDLAGDVLPMVGPHHQDIRVIRDLYPPRVDIEFTLYDKQGKVLAQHRDKLKNLGFLTGMSTYRERQTLGYDKALLQEWIDDILAPALAANRS